jgi:hypothetical protein
LLEVIILDLFVEALGAVDLDPMMAVNHDDPERRHRGAACPAPGVGMGHASVLVAVWVLVAAFP